MFDGGKKKFAKSLEKGASPLKTDQASGLFQGIISPENSVQDECHKLNRGETSEPEYHRS